MKGVTKVLGLVALLAAFSGFSGRANAQTYAPSHRVSTCTPSVQYSQKTFFGWTKTFAHETVCVPYNVPKGILIEQKDCFGNEYYVPGVVYEQQVKPVARTRVIGLDYNIRNSLGAQVLRALTDRGRVETSRPRTTSPMTSRPRTSRPVTQVPTTSRPMTAGPQTCRPVTAGPQTCRPVTCVPVTCQPRPIVQQFTIPRPSTCSPRYNRVINVYENDDGSWIRIEEPKHGDVFNRNEIEYGPDGRTLIRFYERSKKVPTLAPPQNPPNNSIPKNDRVPISQTNLVATLDTGES